jgi:hypothetical protein
LLGFFPGPGSCRIRTGSTTAFGRCRRLGFYISSYSRGSHSKSGTRRALAARMKSPAPTFVAGAGARNGGDHGSLRPAPLYGPWEATPAASVKCARSYRHCNNHNEVRAAPLLAGLHATKHATYYVHDSGAITSAIDARQTVPDLSSVTTSTSASRARDIRLFGPILWGAPVNG